MARYVYIYIYIYIYYTALTCMHTHTTERGSVWPLSVYVGTHAWSLGVDTPPANLWRTPWRTSRCGVLLPVTVTGCTGVWSRTVYMIVWYVWYSYVYRLYLPAQIGYCAGVCLWQNATPYYRTIQNPGIHSDPLPGNGIGRLCIHPYVWLLSLSCTTIP